MLASYIAPQASHLDPELPAAKSRWLSFEPRKLHESMIARSSYPNVPPWGAFSSLEVLVVVQSDGTHCAVEKKELLCSDVVSHLRNVLKLPPRSRVHLQVGPAAKYESVMRVADLLNKSEYPLPVGDLAPEYKD